MHPRVSHTTPTETTARRRRAAARSRARRGDTPSPWRLDPSVETEYGDVEFYDLPGQPGGGTAIESTALLLRELRVEAKANAKATPGGAR